MAGKLPYMPFYTGDWLKEPSLRRATHEAKGVYIDMLCLMWECEERGVLASSGRAWSDEEIARAVGGDQQRTLSCIVELVGLGVVSRDARCAIYCRRMVREEETRQKGTEKVKKWRARKSGKPDDVTTHVTSDVTPDVTDTRDMTFSNRSIDQQVDQLYGLYPKKVAKGAALKAIRKALAREEFGVLLESVTAYAKARQGQDPQFTPHPATWFNAERWKDDRSAWLDAAPRPLKPPPVVPRAATPEELKVWTP